MSNAYMKTVVNYGREEQVLNLSLFVKDLCKVLGGKLSPPKDNETESDHYRTFELGDALISVNKHWEKSKRGKVTIGIAPLNLKLAYGDTPRGPEYTTPSATVSTERPLGQIAADVKRRVIDPGKAPIAALVAHAVLCGEQRNELAATAERLRKAYPMLQVNVKDGERYSASLYRNVTGEPYLSGNVRADGSATIDRLSLTAEQFEAVMKALYPAKTRFPEVSLDKAAGKLVVKKKA